jgi:hypothetical protein
MSNGKSDNIDLLIKNLLHGESVELKDMRANELDNKNAPYQVYTFLDIEQKRLQKLHSIFSDKLSKVLKYPQIDKLLQEQQDQQDELMILLTEKIRPTGSMFNNKMRTLWEKVFTNGTLE